MKYNTSTFQSSFPYFGNLLPNQVIPSLARFPLSKFTYKGRNDRFISAVLHFFGNGVQKTIYLLGSGPIEPFGTAMLPEAESSQIIAFDKEPSIIKLIQESIATQRIAEVDVKIKCNIDSDICAVTGAKGSCLESELEINSQVCGRINARCIDLTINTPSYLNGFKVIFSGFLLVNVDKEHNKSKEIVFVLNNISNALISGGVYAKCTSYGFIQQAGKGYTFLDLLRESKISIEFGIMDRLSITKEGIISSFGIAGTREGSQEDRFNRNYIYKTLRSSLIKNAIQHEFSPKIFQANGEKLSIELKDNSQFVLGFIKISDNIFEVYTVPRRFIINRLLVVQNSFEYSYI